MAHRPRGATRRPGEHGARRARRNAARRAGPRPLRSEAEALARRRRHLGGSARPEIPAEARGRGGCRPDAPHARALGPETRLGTRGVAARRRALVRNDPGRAVPLGRRRRLVANRRRPLEPPGPQGVVWRRGRLSRHPFGARRSARSGRRAHRRVVRRPLDQPRRGRVVAMPRPRYARGLHAAGPGIQSADPGSTPHRAVRERARSPLDSAPQRHLPQHRRRP